jgi:hypothetical protein
MIASDLDQADARAAYAGVAVSPPRERPKSQASSTCNVASWPGDYIKTHGCSFA